MASAQHKRKRASLPDVGSDADALSLSTSIYDLPDATLLHIADYLPKTSLALLAVALTDNQSSWNDVNWDNTSSVLTWIKTPKKKPSAATKVLLKSSASNREQWLELDFVDIDKSLAHRLTDDDIAAVLSAINARKKLRSLKITGCVNITGSGLEPLRGSVVLERLDLSTREEHENSDTMPNVRVDDEAGKKPKRQPLISENDVIPILNSIIDSEGNLLKYLHLPKNWRVGGTLDVDQFLQRYEDSQNERLLCQACNLHCQNMMATCNRERMYGAQQYACYQCLGRFCHNCEIDTDTPRLRFCSGCEKSWCFKCSGSGDECDRCEKTISWFCSGCIKKRICPACDDIVCGIDECSGWWNTCKSCNKVSDHL